MLLTYSLYTFQILQLSLLNNSYFFTKYIINLSNMISVASETKLQQLNLKFDFETLSGKLIIKVQAEDARYQAEVSARPDLDFNDIQKAFNAQKFIVIAKKADILKLAVANLDIEFHNVDKIMIAELQRKEAESRRQIVRLNELIELKSNEIENINFAYTQLRKSFVSLEQNSQQAISEISQLNKIIAQKDKEIQQIKITMTQKNLSKITSDSEVKQQKKIQKPKLIPSLISPEDLYMYSKIVTEKLQNQNIKRFLNRKIKSFKLLYRASQNFFSPSNFHEKCDNIPNTLILCKTQFNKKIGGFTPLIWQKSFSESQYQRDESGLSFIFSLTHNDKFVLKNKNFAISYSMGGPAFGGDSNSMHDFRIGEGNRDLNSAARINTSYYNSNYNQDDKNSFIRFNGNPNGSPMFSVEEWQVWVLEWA